MPAKCATCNFYIFSVDSHSTSSCQKNVEMINLNPIGPDEKDLLVKSLVSGNLKINIKPDSINFTSLVDSSYRCPLKSCFDTFEKMDSGKLKCYVKTSDNFPGFRQSRKTQEIPQTAQKKSNEETAPIYPSSRFIESRFYNWINFRFYSKNGTR